MVNYAQSALYGYSRVLKMHPSGSNAKRFQTEVEINHQQLVLTHQILEHRFLMCEEMINDGSPAAGEKEGIRYPGKAVVWVHLRNDLCRTFHTRKQFPNRIHVQTLIWVNK